MMRRVREHAPSAELWGAEVQQMARPGREVIIGARRDPQFGHLIMFGLGGIFVEVLGDVSFRVAPIDRGEAQDMIREIRGFRLLQGVRGQPPADTEAIVDCLLRVSRLLADLPEIEELDINPLVVWGQGEGAMALDARVVLS